MERWEFERQDTGGELIPNKRHGMHGTGLTAQAVQCGRLVSVERSFVI